MSKFGRKQRDLPDGWDYVEPTLTALENELRDKVNEPHEGLRRVESSWPVHQINWQKSRYIYDLYYTYHRISKELYDYCVEEKLIDASLIAKWKKQGYERLCSTTAINPKNSKFGTVSICRVPRSALDGQNVENQTTGCRGCASGATTKNIFDNKYGQYLAQIQIAREERLRGGGEVSASASASATKHAQSQAKIVEGAPTHSGVVGSADGGEGETAKRSRVWALDAEEESTAAEIASAADEVTVSAGTGAAATAVSRDAGAGAGADSVSTNKQKAKYAPPGKRSRVK